MNKIKILYDVVKVMKEKEIVKGIANLEVVKSEIKVVSLTNEFSRDTVSGDIKAKISKEINLEGNKVKQETNIESNVKEHPIHKFHPRAHMGHGNKFQKILFALNALNNLKAEEKEDKTILSIDLKEVLKEGKELRAKFQENNGGLEGKQGFGPHKHPEFIKKFFSAEYKDAVLIVVVNKASEIERIDVLANGDNIISGSVNFIW